MKKINTCPLCSSESTIFFQRKERLYHQCSNCSGIFVDKALLPEPTKEKQRYKEHNNDVENEGYQKFVSPITSAILKSFSENHIGLDFGAGTGPVIAKILNDNNYNIKLYDPFFHNIPELLNEKYNYIACCEVMEHFHNPFKEFKLLKRLLKPNGKLFCLTHIYHVGIPFANWYYKNDPTHVFIYQKETLAWIKKEFGFSKMEIEGNFIWFTS
jgi:SAM-dependent methyltransferase